MNFGGRRVLVTGAGGFIGSHLAERLIELGAVTRCLVHYNALGAAGWLDRSPLRREIEVVAGDVCDPDSVRNAMRGVEVVFHLAALIGIPYSYQAPKSYVRVNIEGTLNVLQAAREFEVQRLVHTSTSEVYGTALYAPIDERHPLQGQSPYSASKIGADKLVEAYRSSFNLPVITVRPFNTFGPRQSARAVIPTIIGQCLAGGKVVLGSLHPTRDLNFVSNTVEGFLLAASAPEALGLTINLGSGREISVGNLAELIARIVGREITVKASPERVRPEGSEVDRLLADNSLAQRILGWRPKVTLEEGLTQTVEWMKRNEQFCRPSEYVV